MAMGWTALVALIVCCNALIMQIQGAIADENDHGIGSQCQPKQDTVLTYFLQQQYGVNELLMVPAAQPAVNGTFSAGVGLEVVYEFEMTSTADPSSDNMGFVRGTAIVVNNTAAATVFFVSNVIHYDYAGVAGTLSQQGEAVFTNPFWEFAILGGTAAFRNARGYNNGIFVSATHTPNGTHIVTYYEAHISTRP